MTRLRWRARFAACIVVCHVAVFTNVAQAQTSSYGEYVVAARALADWQFPEARKHIERLRKKWPKSVESQYLQAELAFLDGDYGNAVKRLESLRASALGGQVETLRSLATSTRDVTAKFRSYQAPSGHFEIRYPPGKDEVIVALAADVLERAYSAIGADLGFYPKEIVRVEFLDAPSDLARLSTLTEKDIETTGTIALCKYGKLMVVSPRATVYGYPWMDTLVHEYVHYVVSRASRDRVPVWLQEGLARFEQSRWRAAPGVVLGGTESHLLAEALAKKQLIPFRSMHPSMAKLPSQKAAALAFTEVYTMVGYLHSKLGYEGLRKIIALHVQGQKTRPAVAKAVGVSWRKVESGWKKHLRSYKLKTSRALAGRASADRVRFRKQNSHSSQDTGGASEIADKQARKFARLGGILRARGMTRAAAIEYEKALAKTGRDEPFVAARLSRVYLELRQYDRAIALAKPLIALDPNDAAPPTTLGAAYVAKQAWQPARDNFEVALRVSPFDPTVRCGLAEVYRQQNAAQLAAREDKACKTLAGKK